MEQNVIGSNLALHFDHCSGGFLKRHCARSMIEILNLHPFQACLRETASHTIPIKFLNEFSAKAIQGEP